MQLVDMPLRDGISFLWPDAVCAAGLIMPLYEYELCEGDCKVCGGRFTLQRPLDAKSRELIKLGMAAASRSESGVQSHVYRALEAGATTAEVQHALIIGINTLGFSTMMAALTWAKQAIRNHT